MSELCVLTGDYTCDEDYEDCSECPTYTHESEKNIDKELPWRVQTIVEMSLQNGLQEKS